MMTSSSFSKAYSDIVATGGRASLYRGAGICFINAISGGAELALYDKIQSFISNKPI